VPAFPNEEIVPDLDNQPTHTLLPVKKIFRFSRNITNQSNDYKRKWLFQKFLVNLCALSRRDSNGRVLLAKDLNVFNCQII